MPGTQDTSPFIPLHSVDVNGCENTLTKGQYMRLQCAGDRALFGFEK